MKDKKRRENMKNLKELEENIALIEAPKELLKQKVLLLDTPSMNVDK